MTAINDNGSVVGYAPIAAGTGFVAHPDGFWAQIAVPGDPHCVNQTIPQAINASGTIAGSWATNYYGDPSCALENTGGFVLSPEGTLTLFSFPVGQQNYPDASHGFLSQTHWFSMNQMGDIVSSYDDANGYTHGFVRNPYGNITSFDHRKAWQPFPVASTTQASLPVPTFTNTRAVPPLPLSACRCELSIHARCKPVATVTWVARVLQRSGLAS